MSDDNAGLLGGQLEAEYQAARRMVNDLCKQRREWRMSIPARPDYDPDLVIARALDDLYAELIRARGEGETMEIKQSARGFKRVEFIDRYGQKCSLQESSLATEDAIWFGVDVDLNGVEVHDRMHLTQAMAEALLPYLESFVETGSPFALAEPPATFEK